MNYFISNSNCHAPSAVSIADLAYNSLNKFYGKDPEDISQFDASEKIRRDWDFELSSIELVNFVGCLFVFADRSELAIKAYKR